MTTVMSWLDGQLVHALVYLGVVTGVDVLLGVILAGLYRTFDLRKLRDFVVTTVGFEHVVAFAAAVGLMFLNKQPLTQAIVAGLAMTYATTVLPDLYDKLATLLLKAGVPQLPLSKSVAPKGAGA